MSPASPAPVRRFQVRRVTKRALRLRDSIPDGVSRLVPIGTRISVAKVTNANAFVTDAETGEYLGISPVPCLATQTDLVSSPHPQDNRP